MTYNFEIWRMLRYMIAKLNHTSRAEASLAEKLHLAQSQIVLIKNFLARGDFFC